VSCHHITPPHPSPPVNYFLHFKTAGQFACGPLGIEAMGARSRRSRSENDNSKVEQELCVFISFVLLINM